MAGDEKLCRTCGETFLALRTDIKFCSMACAAGTQEARACRACGTYFRPRVSNQMTCPSLDCRRKVEKQIKKQSLMRAEASSLKAVKIVTETPFASCVSCVHWKKEPPGTTAMGGQCLAEAFNRCKPWGPALCHKEKK